MPFLISVPIVVGTNMIPQRIVSELINDDTRPETPLCEVELQRIAALPTRAKIPQVGVSAQNGCNEKASGLQYPGQLLQPSELKVAVQMSKDGRPDHKIELCLVETRRRKWSDTFELPCWKLSSAPLDRVRDRVTAGELLVGKGREEMRQQSSASATPIQNSPESAHVVAQANRRGHIRKDFQPLRIEARCVRGTDQSEESLRWRRNPTATVVAQERTQRDLSAGPADTPDLDFPRDGCVR